jgi:predicted AlkP superfamily phosphohydrolase/phosphomutase
MKSALVRNRVVVIGLDGAAWQIIDSGIQNNLLPTFEKLKSHGAWAEMQTTIPPSSPPAWTSMMAGVNPGKHGVFDFEKVNREHQPSFFLSNNVKAKQVWDYLPDKYRSLLVNYPVSYPPPGINGIVVSGMMAPGLKSEFTNPPTLKEEILSDFPDYVIDLNWSIYGKGKRFLQALHHATERRLSLFRYLYGKETWNLTVFVITETDRMQHLYWDEDELLQFYGTLDRFLSEVVAECEKTGIMLFLVSDHGFGKVS